MADTKGRLPNWQGIESSKPQFPNPREAPITKLQNPVSNAEAVVELGLCGYAIPGLLAVIRKLPWPTTERMTVADRLCQYQVEDLSRWQQPFKSNAKKPSFPFAPASLTTVPVTLRNDPTPT